MDYEMENWMRFILICKPEQSGKTFIMIQNIIRDLREPIDGKQIINFILCDNNLLLTRQTCSRVSEDLKEFQVNGETYLEFSSHKRTEYHDAISVAGAITTKGVKNILCCTNGKRIDDIDQLITSLNDGPYTKGKLHFKIWLDEADKFTGFINTTLKPLVDEYRNINVYCITATAKKLFDQYQFMNVLPIENTTTPQYHGWCDNKIRLIDDDSSCEDFVEHVLTNVANLAIQPGTNWFIPAKYKKTSHEKIKDKCVSKGFAVFVVNGNGIRLTLPSKEMIIYKKDDEFNTKIKQIYHEKDLKRFPVAITGNVCIGRGISIMSDDFMMDFGIFSDCGNPQEASQNSGRLKGNMKHWPNYKPPVVFTTEKFNKVAIEWEKKSRNLAELAFQKEERGEEPIISKSEYKTLGEDYEYMIHEELFTSFAQAQKFLQTKSRVMKCKTKISKNSVIHDREGYKVTSKLLKPGQSVADLTKEDRITYSGSRDISAGQCISSTEKGSRYLILPVYETLDTPPNREKYQVRYIHFKN